MCEDTTDVGAIGIFLSPMDVFIQEHFFNLPFQTAFVVDPCSANEGLFQWRNGKAVPVPQYWVGSEVHASSPRGASHRNSEVPSQSPGPKKKPDPDIIVRATEPLPSGRPPLTRSVALDIAKLVLLCIILALVAAQFFVGPWDKVQEKTKSLWDAWGTAPGESKQ